MKKWQDIVDQLVKDVVGDGDISHLPGAGRPLQLQDESHTPTELRAAHKIMNDNNVLPDWVAAGRALDQLEEKLRLQIRMRAICQRQIGCAISRGAEKVNQNRRGLETLYAGV